MKLLFLTSLIIISFQKSFAQNIVELKQLVFNKELDKKLIEKQTSFEERELTYQLPCYNFQGEEIGKNFSFNKILLGSGYISLIVNSLDENKLLAIRIYQSDNPPTIGKIEKTIKMEYGEGKVLYKEIYKEQNIMYGNITLGWVDRENRCHIYLSKSYGGGNNKQTYSFSIDIVFMEAVYPKTLNFPWKSLIERYESYLRLRW